MGTRLYPCTQNPESIEILAHVPVGTFSKLEALKAEFPDFTELLDELHGHEEYRELRTLHEFQLFGWGRLQGNAARYGLDETCGSTTDQEVINYLLEKQFSTCPEDYGTDIELVARLSEGLCWS